MNFRKVFIFLAFPALILTGLTQADSRRSLHPGNSQSPVQQRTDNEDLPIADFNSPDHPNLEKRSLRRLRNSRHDSHDRASDNRFALKEDSAPVLLQLEASHVSPEPALPVPQSDAIIIGEVTDAEAFLSNDKASVYSEFTLWVSEVLKNGSAPLSPGVSITAERPGGRVRFPSGKILVRGGNYGRHMPLKGRRYLLFLEQIPEAQSFSIITGYELRAGQIFPLDHTPRGEGQSKQFINYERYKGEEEATFLAKVRQAIANSAPRMGGQK